MCGIAARHITPKGVTVWGGSMAINMRPLRGCGKAAPCRLASFNYDEAVPPVGGGASLIWWISQGKA